MMFPINAHFYGPICEDNLEQAMNKKALLDLRTYLVYATLSREWESTMKGLLSLMTFSTHAVHLYNKWIAHSASGKVLKL